MPKILPSAWQESDKVLKAVQVAFDAEENVIKKVRKAAFKNNLSNSDQIRLILGLPISHKPVRPRLTLSLTELDYQELAERYGLDPEQRLEIKARVLQELIKFADQ